MNLETLKSLAKAARMREENEDCLQGVSLEEAYRRLNVRHDFKAGDLVEFKPGLRDKKWPEYGHFAVVQEVLPVPVVDEEQESDTQHFRIPLDLVLLLKAEGEMCLFYFDSRRLQPYVRPVIDESTV